MIDSIEEKLGTYLLPFNPNSLFGLRGVNFYHRGGNVFNSQPRIPETLESPKNRGLYRFD